MLKKGLSEEVFFYLDPTYYEKGKELYLNYYTDKDHREIALEVKRLKDHKWIVTYDCADLIKSLYSKNKIIEYTLNYSVGKARKGKELMIFSNNIVT
jgi:DNA adenine methylase